MLTSQIGTKQAGFTLLELLLVIGLMGLIAGLCLPNWRGRQEEASLRLASAQLAQLCRYAVSLAAGSNEQVTLGRRGDTFFLETQDGVSEEYTLPAALTYSGPRELIFFPDGVRQEAVLALLNHEARYTVKIEPGGVVSSFPGGEPDE